MFTTLLLSLSVGLLNAIRGSGFWKKGADGESTGTLSENILARDSWLFFITLCIMIAIVVSGKLPLQAAMIYTPICMLTCLFAWSFGWGKYMNVAFPNIKYADEKEVLTIDWLCDKIVGKPTNEKQFIVWCFVAFAFRSLLFYPIFMFLALVTHSYVPLVCGLGVLSQPVIYWLRKVFKPEGALRKAELAYGAALGASIGLSLL